MNANYIFLVTISSFYSLARTRSTFLSLLLPSSMLSPTLGSPALAAQQEWELCSAEKGEMQQNHSVWLSPADQDRRGSPGDKIREHPTPPGSSQALDVDSIARNLLFVSTATFWHLFMVYRRPLSTPSPCQHSRCAEQRAVPPAMPRNHHRAILSCPLCIDGPKHLLLPSLPPRRSFPSRPQAPESPPCCAHHPLPAVRASKPTSLRKPLPWQLA